MGAHEHVQARTSTFKQDFEGRVKGLDPAVYQSLVMRQGVDTVKTDVHVRRSRGDARPQAQRPGRDRADDDEGAARLGIKPVELDWRIWEASRGGAFPYPAAPT